MQTIAPDEVTEVAVGVLRRPGQEYLIQQRLPGKPCEGQWEFPGGKVEPGESAEQALARELREELGVIIGPCQPLIRLEHRYSHAHVSLMVYLVQEFNRQPRCLEGQNIAWSTTEQILAMDVLPPVKPIIEALQETLGD